MEGSGVVKETIERGLVGCLSNKTRQMLVVTRAIPCRFTRRVKLILYHY